MRALLSLLCLSGLAVATGPNRPTYFGPEPPREIRRVVTLAPSLTELVLALGKGPLLVGVSRFDDAPQVASLPRVGGFVDPSVEAVLRLAPDLVLVQPAPGNEQPVMQMARLQVPVLAVPLQTVREVLVAFREVGEALGAAPRGQALARDLEATRKEIRARAAALPRPRVLFVYGFQPLVVAGPASFAGELLTDAGGRNVVESPTAAYPIYSVESVVAAHPEVILDATQSSHGKEVLMQVPALARARWITLPSLDLLHPGPRLADGLRELFGLLHPGTDAGR